MRCSSCNLNLNHLQTEMLASQNVTETGHGIAR
jgi:hypothetical protein